jgi:hypothetical protein
MCRFFGVVRFAHIGGPPLGVRIAQTGDAVRRPKGSRSWSEGFGSLDPAVRMTRRVAAGCVFARGMRREVRHVPGRTPIPSYPAAAAPQPPSVATQHLRLPRNPAIRWLYCQLLSHCDVESIAKKQMLANF